ncbi:hypothetical protein B0T14DRAFT_567676 [Immersiella caudata]|uniref:Uncharacterized protein n=1 Tax=Immersiella caudata TaxID=314043 RepID=A0AA40C0Y9_9PEZI|nr:hypothetical protein B0T14DRAFT_567676 [Immersiella caudata]
MVASVLAISLLGLSAVNALPSNVQDRQGWIIGGPSNGAITPGTPGGGLPSCNPDLPLEKQEPCLYQPVTGELRPAPKKRQTLIPSNASKKEAIKTLELELQRLEKKKSPSKAEKSAITTIKKELKRLAGIKDITPPPGGSSTFVPGKRDSISLGSFGAYKGFCPPSTTGLRQALSILLAKPRRSEEETLAIIDIVHILSGCGASISDEGATFTPIVPRDNSDLVGLQAAYADGIAALGSHTPSFTSFIILTGLEDTLTSAGLTVSGPSGTVSLAPRQQRIGTCDPIDVLLLMTLYRSILREYGTNTSRWPSSVTSQARSILTVLSLCGEPTSTISPVPYVPGGSITPQPTIPGGTITPQPTIPGGNLEPVPMIPGGGNLEPAPTIPGGEFRPGKRDLDSAKQALAVLEKQYGTYQSGKIPTVVFLPMAQLVAYLQGQGVVVLGWPKSTIGVAP